MKAVNLLPANRRALDGGGRPGSAYFLVGALGFVLVAVLAYVLAANSVTSKREELGKVRAEAAAAQQQAAALGAFGSFASIKQTREASITRLAEARLDWERLARELSRVLPDDVFVSSLEASAGGAPVDAGAAAAGATGPSLKLTGCAPSNPDVATLMVRLRKLHRASDVGLSNTARTAGDATGCGKGYAFALTVNFDPAAPREAGKKVPAHLGGGA